MIRAARSTVNRRLWPRSTGLLYPTVMEDTEREISVLTTAGVEMKAVITHTADSLIGPTTLIVSRQAVRSIA